MRTSFFAFCDEKIVAKATPTQSDHPLLVGVRLRTSFSLSARKARGQGHSYQKPKQQGPLDDDGLDE